MSGVAEKISLRLISQELRQRAISLVARAPNGWVMKLVPPARTEDQNAKLWPMLNDIARAQPDGRQMTADQWKCAFMDAAGFKPVMIEAIDGGGFICLGYKSSRLSKAEFSDLIETIYEYGARKGVRFSEPRATKGEFYE